MTQTKLLLVDDEEGIRKVLNISLQDIGYRVFLAKDGSEALELFRKEEPAIVLTDIKMPGMDGVELLRRVKRERPDTEVIMLTGHGDMDLVVKSLKYEATYFITKPVDNVIMEAALERAEKQIDSRRKRETRIAQLEHMLAEAMNGVEPESPPPSAASRIVREVGRLALRLKISLLAMDQAIAEGNIRNMPVIYTALQEIFERMNVLAKKRMTCTIP
ncbi:Two-component system sensor histidine kinase [Olavius algarvensis associated proteobacterium Delta 3]|nr:Two-component system sensor histidine kinase [Olavius algarvensis associated proteobacterium Delta 3]